MSASRSHKDSDDRQTELLLEDPANATEASQGQTKTPSQSDPAASSTNPGKPRSDTPSRVPKQPYRIPDNLGIGGLGAWLSKLGPERSEEPS